jgi:uncharacterized membrane protein/Mg-chelatase subunit ChlD
MIQELGRWTIAIGQPWWLLALALALPVIVWSGRRSLSGMGRFRRTLAILLRSAVVACIVVALAEPQAVRISSRLTTIFLLDASQSIPQEWQARALEFFNAANERQKPPDDLSGLIAFGKDARVEVPPSSNPAPTLAIENTIDGENTDLAAALKLALASFPEDTARRLVVLSDGNANRGDTLEQVLAAKNLGVPIDVLPIEYRYDREVLVERVALPPDVKKGETVNINVVVRASEPTTGSLQLFQTSENATVPVGAAEPQHVELRRGVNVLTLKKTIDEPRFYTFSAEFFPDPGTGDRRAVNNRAEGFTHARGEARVLLIESERGEHAELVRALEEKKIAVTVLLASRIDPDRGIVPGDPMPTDIAQLQPFDAVILANVPKDALTEEQQSLLERNTHDFGAGLVMLGGPNSFGAGGWMNTPIEKALPVDMQIPATKVTGKSAMAMIMHASEIPEGNYWQKKVAQEALKTLSAYDYAGMLHWEGQEAWLFTVRPIGTSQASMLRAIDRMTPGDMPTFDPSLTLAINGLKRAADAMTRHIIVISDGDPSPPSQRIINQLVAAKITVTTVLVAAHGGDAGALFTMQNLARKTKGRFYNVTNPRALPRIYQREARLISRSLIYERSQPWQPQLIAPSEPVLGLTADALPGITGIVQTSIKPTELVETPILSPLPTATGNKVPVLSHWTYGLGRAAAFTSDAGRRWATAWTSWDGYANFWAQLLRWTMRPVDNGNLTMSLQREGGSLKVVVDALDTNQQFLNFAEFQGVVVRPDLSRQNVRLQQTAPGRYEGTVPDTDARGNYFVTLGYSQPGGGNGLITSGISVPYSEEYRELRSNAPALDTLSELTGGKVLAWKQRDGRLDLDATLAQSDAFRRDPAARPPRSFAPLWPALLALACFLFLADVATRRIAPDLDRIRDDFHRAWARLRGENLPERSDYIEKLQGRKADVAREIDRTRGASRFDAPDLPPPDRPSPVDSMRDENAQASRPTDSAAKDRPGLAPGPQTPTGPESYADRLLKAKQKARDEIDRSKDKDKPA